MNNISFHSEVPATKDVFPGGSHEKVAIAIQNYLLSDGASKVIGLDGAFGSGKSSILHMLKENICKDVNRRVWFFDCEQNYQGSTKSNFIELFTEEVIKDVPPGSAKASRLADARDVALGRQFCYRKKTTSRVSGWAIALVAALFFSSSSFKELFALSRAGHSVSSWLIVVHGASLASPALVMFCAWLANRNKLEGGRRWSLLSLFKGSSEDYINEKIEVAKEVTPLDLKRALIAQLGVVDTLSYVVILDNLDRLPKESLREVWSDLEIFTSVSELKNLTVIVPFCSSRVAKYLDSMSGGGYDSRDFISKKFPVVFRAPPVISSGWKDGFAKLWCQTFGEHGRDEVVHCAQLLHSHSPMANRIVTPRLQKRYINDIAATSLVVGGHISRVAIAAHVLLCRYHDFSIEEVLREGESASSGGVEDHVTQISEAQRVLLSVLGGSRSSGWQIQLLQIHFLTSGEIAIAELLDEPIKDAFATGDASKLLNTASLFGFIDSMRRYVSTGPSLARMLPVIHRAQQESSGQWAQSVMSVINVSRPQVLVQGEVAGESFFAAIPSSLASGLSPDLFDQHGVHLSIAFLDKINSPYAPSDFHVMGSSMLEYDHLLHALGRNSIDPVDIRCAEYLIHLLVAYPELRVIGRDCFLLSDAAFASANKQLASCDAHTMSMTPLRSEDVEDALLVVYGGGKFGRGLVGGLPISEIALLADLCQSSGYDKSAALGITLAKTVNEVVTDAADRLIVEGADGFAQAVCAVVYIRARKLDALASIPDLNSVMGSELFRALAIAALSADKMLGLLEDERFDGPVGSFLASMIVENRISHLSVEWVLKNYGPLVTSVGAHGVSSDEVFRWFSAWNARMDLDISKLGDVDGKFLAMALGEGSVAYPILNSSLQESFITSSKEQWRDVLLSCDERHLTFARAMIPKSIQFDDEAAVAEVVLDVLSENAAGKLALSDAGILLAGVLLENVGKANRDIVGVHLRTLCLDEGSDPQRTLYILGIFGHLIPDFSPSSSKEVGVLLGLLECIRKAGPTFANASRYLDSRAHQIAAYTYSKELREAVGTSIAQMSADMPALYRTFSEKRGFKAMLRGIRASGKGLKR